MFEGERFAFVGPGVMAECPAERAKLRLICAWVDDEGDPDAKSSYKFPHHLVDGKVVKAGCDNAMARLGQADIPEGDRAGVEKHLKHHQDQFAEAESHDSDEDKSSEADAIEQALLDGLQTLTTTVKEVVS